jgi:hypothetical protein
VSARLARALGVAIVAGVAVTAVGCRPDPGASRYDQQEPFPHADGGDASLPGPNPYLPGQRRLSIGAFYENDASDVVAVDNMASNLYVYMDTVTLLPDPDHLEGKTSTRATHAGLTWWGFGVHWMTPRDLGAWTHLHVSLKSHDEAFATLDIGMNNANPVFVHAPDYGYANDDAWHSLTIPVADFVAAGLDVTQVAAPFVLTGGAGTGGEKLLVDDVYFTAD